MNVILDVDGVILDYMSHFARFMEYEGMPPKVSHLHEGDYNLVNMFPGLSRPEVTDHMVRMSRMPEWFSTFPLMPGAAEGIRRLREITGGSIVCLTSAGQDPEQYAWREHNLRGLGLDGLEMLPFGADKEEALSKYEPGSLFVDDLPANLLKGELAGMETVLFHSPMNITGRGSFRVADDWPHLLEHARELTARPVEPQPAMLSF